SSTRAQQSLPGPTMTRRRRECSRQRDSLKQLVAAVDAAHASVSVGENAAPQVSLELGHDEAGQTAPILFDLRQERLEVPPELSRTGATSPARGGDSSKLQRRTAVALPALRSAVDLRRRGPRRWRLFMKRANRSSLGGLTFRRRGSSDSRQPVEQNGQAESRSDPKNRATRPTPSPSSTLHKLELFSLYRRTLFASLLDLLQMTSASLDARRTVVDVDVLHHRPTFYAP